MPPPSIANVVITSSVETPFHPRHRGIDENDGGGDEFVDCQLKIGIFGLAPGLLGPF